MADYTYDPGLVVDDDGEPVPNSTGTLHATIGGAAVAIEDLQGTPIANLTASDKAYIARFSADIPRGYANFGSLWIPVASDQVQDSLTVATAAAASAAAAQTNAATSATSSSTSATAALAAQAAAEAAEAAFGTHAHTLAAMTDVDFTPAPTDGQVLTWEATTSRWEPGTPSTGGIASETLLTAPAGSTFIVNYYDTVFSPANTWPAARPSTRGDIYFIWRGPSDPGTRVGAQDSLWLVQPSA